MFFQIVQNYYCPSKERPWLNSYTAFANCNSNSTRTADPGPFWIKLAVYAHRQNLETCVFPIEVSLQQVLSIWNQLYSFAGTVKSNYPSPKAAPSLLPVCWWFSPVHFSLGDMDGSDRLQSDSRPSTTKL